MEIEQAIKLIHYPGLPAKAPMRWAELGAGDGLFTLALASLLVPGSRIIAVDKRPFSHEKIKAPKGIQIESVQADFLTDVLGLGSLNGLLMANALHFVADKISFLKKISSYLREDAVILIIEYDRDIPNRWVPYPVSFDSLKVLFDQCFGKTVRKINEIPSLFNQSMIYGAWTEMGSFQ